MHYRIMTTNGQSKIFIKINDSNTTIATNYYEKQNKNILVFKVTAGFQMIYNNFD